MTAQVADEELIRLYAGQAVTHVNKDMYRAWLGREFVLQRCAKCGRWQQPPAPLCAGCWSCDLSMQPASGLGTIHLLIRLHQGPEVPGVDYAAGPVPVATVELDEQAGLRLSGIVTGEDAERAAIGDRVVVTWLDRNGAFIPAFRIGG